MDALIIEKTKETPEINFNPGVLKYLEEHTQITFIKFLNH